MTHKYQRYWESDLYKTGIYDNCNAVLYVRSDGNRARIEQDCVRWQGNTGGYNRDITYVNGHNAVKSICNRLRQSQSRALRQGYASHSITVIADILDR